MCNLLEGQNSHTFIISKWLTRSYTDLGVQQINVCEFCSFYETYLELCCLTSLFPLGYRTRYNLANVQHIVYQLFSQSKIMNNQHFFIIFVCLVGVFCEQCKNGDEARIKIHNWIQDAMQNCKNESNCHVQPFYDTDITNIQEIIWKLICLYHGFIPGNLYRGIKILDSTCLDLVFFQTKYDLQNR